MIKLELLDTKPEKNENTLNLSVSKLKTFLSCKAKFKFSYIEKLPQKDKDFTIFGKFLHDILESFHKIYVTDEFQPLNKVMQKSWNASREKYKDKVTDEQLKEAWNYCLEYLKIQAELIANNKMPKFLSAEKEFNLNINDTILLSGFIDKVERDQDNVIHVSDYKTSKSKKFLASDFFQLKTYGLILALENPEIKTVRCSYIMIKHNFEYLTQEFSVDELMEVPKYYLENSLLIKKESAYKPSTSILCNWCDYLENCVDGSKFSANLANKQSKNFYVEGALTDWNQIK
jgi:RecB family exonuclease